MSRLKILIAVMLVLALFSGAATGIAAAQGESDESHCEGLDTADEKTDDTVGNETVNDVHSQCHHGELG